MKQQIKDENVLHALIRREYYPKNGLRKSLQILKTLVCRGNYEFRKVWEQSSKQLICCESNTIFSDNYRTAYSGYGLHNGAPVPKFSISQDKLPRKIVDAVLSRSKPTTIHKSGQWTGKPGNKMYAITSSSLLVVDLNTGRVGFEILLLLSDVINFKHINWLQTEESIVLSTTLCPRLPPRQRRLPAQGPSNLVKVLAVFTTLPITFVCMFEVTRKVFGADVTDVMMCQGLLAVMHQSRHVRLYDFQHMLAKYKVQPLALRNSRYGDSAPLNINMKITELPRCLFVTRCEEWNVQIGGHPWHYLISPVGSRGYFSVHSLCSGDVAKDGSMESDSESIDFDRAVFHADDSSRIIHIGPEAVRVFWLKETDEDGGSVLLPAFTINLQYPRLQAVGPLMPIITSSGRQVKRRFSMDEITGANMCTTIHEVDYEDELDVLMVCYTVHQPNALQGTLGIYDNLTGGLLKSVKLDEPWSDYLEHTVILDKDTIIHIVKSTNGKFLCQVYRLFERCHDNPPSARPKPSRSFEDELDSNFSAPENPRVRTSHRRQLAALASRRRQRPR